MHVLNLVLSYRFMVCNVVHDCFKQVVSVERLLIERNKVLDLCVMSSEDALYKVQHVSLTLGEYIEF